MRACDFSVARPSTDEIKAAGFTGVLRYLAPLPNPKVISSEEIDSYLAAGLSVGLVWESTANRAGQGYSAGRADCIAAEQLAAALHIPIAATIYYAVDFDATPDAIRPYFQAIADVHTRTVGGYGSYRVIEALLDWGLVAKAWQTTAWSYTVDPVTHRKVLQRSDRAHLFQTTNASIPDVDDNEILQADWGQFPAPAQPEDDEEMTYTYVRVINTEPVYAARHGEEPVHVGGKRTDGSVFGYEDVEFLISYQGDKVKADVGADVPDAKGASRKVLDLDTPEAIAWFGLA